MKKRMACLLLAAAICGLGLGLGAAGGALAAADSVKVTYRVANFADVVKEIPRNTGAPELTVTDVHGTFFSTADHKLVSDGLETEWYLDAGMTQRFGFDVGMTEDTVLYGKVVETKAYVLSNGYGWDAQSGIVYAGDAIDNNYLTTTEYVSPNYVDAETGKAILSFSGIKYAVYARGLDVSKPFSVTMSFNDVQDDNGTCWFLFSMFPTVTFAQAALQGPWANAGAASCLMFNLGTDPVGITAMNVGSPILGYPSTTDTRWVEQGKEFQRLFGDGSSVQVDVNIGETGTAFSIGGTTFATSTAKRADFPSGYAYLHFAGNGSPAQRIETEVAVAQEHGTYTASGDDHVQVGPVTVNGMAVSAQVTLDEGYVLDKVTANGTEVKLVKVYGTTDTYAFDLPAWQTGDVEFKAAAKKEGGTAGGCGGCSSTAGPAALLSLLALAGLACFKNH